MSAKLNPFSHEGIPGELDLELKGEVQLREDLVDLALAKVGAIALMPGENND